MLDKLLRRIAKRKAAPGDVPLSVMAAGSHGESSNISSAGAQDPFSTSYPASGRKRSVRTGQTLPGAQNPWVLASDSYIRARLDGAPISDQPAYFAGWGVAQMAVAHMLWAEHERLHLGEVTIHCGKALLAVVQPTLLNVWINAAAYQQQEPLSLHQMAEDQCAKRPDTSAFAAHAMYGLLWFYGQVYSGAPDLLPPEIGEQLIQLRRFPPIAPAALEMRHLALIHVFSGGALSFAQLQKQISPEHAGSLCADLASLYFTGALRLLP